MRGLIGRWVMRLPKHTWSALPGWLKDLGWNHGQPK